MNLSDFEKRIYNQYLYACRVNNNKPFSPRKQFDDVDSETLVTLKRIAGFLEKFPNINLKDFFDAPFKMNESKHIALSFFNSMRAIKLFSLYTFEQLQNADSEWTIEKIKQSMLFIYNFCRANNVAFNNYMMCAAPSGIPWFVLHLQQFSINIYALLAFPNADKQLNGNANHLDEIIGNNLSKKLSTYNSKFVTSTKCKQVARLAYEKINQQNQTNNLEKQNK
jgi:hypothetical protein